MDDILKVGDTVWGICKDGEKLRVKELIIKRIQKGKFSYGGTVFYQTYDNGSGFYDSMLGKTVFLSKEEAERKFYG